NELFTNKILNDKKFELINLPSPDEKMKKLRSMGLVPFDLPESYRFAPRFPEYYGSYVFKNPESYGKAYLAKWVKSIKPSENHFNKSVFELGLSWPRSPELLQHFKEHLAEIPDIPGATLIESTDLKDFAINPHEYQSNSDVDIVKIIASKAVFNVDCKEEHCWLVYNSAALKGWQAYSGSQRLSIQNANLGFIGVKLERGTHFVWMEFSPVEPVIGLIVTCGGWILALGLCLRHLSRLAFYHNSKTVHKIERLTTT
ncbi:uncharacterized protein METZ01_LOCUS241379, partial [marine metagenome]